MKRCSPLVGEGGRKTRCVRPRPIQQGDVSECPVCFGEKGLLGSKPTWRCTHSVCSACDEQMRIRCQRCPLCRASRKDDRSSAIDICVHILRPSPPSHTGRQRRALIDLPCFPFRLPDAATQHEVDEGGRGAAADRAVLLWTDSDRQHTTGDGDGSWQFTVLLMAISS